MLCNFSVRMLHYFQTNKQLNFFLPIKTWKNHPKKLHAYGSWEVFFSLQPRLPKTAQNFISHL